MIPTTESRSIIWSTEALKYLWTLFYALSVSSYFRWDLGLYFASISSLPYLIFCIRFCWLNFRSSNSCFFALISAKSFSSSLERWMATPWPSRNFYFCLFLAVCPNWILGYLTICVSVPIGLIFIKSRYIVFAISDSFPCICCFVTFISSDFFLKWALKLASRSGGAID